MNESCCSGLASYEKVLHVHVVLVFEFERPYCDAFYWSILFLAGGKLQLLLDRMVVSEVSTVS